MSSKFKTYSTHFRNLFLSSAPFTFGLIPSILVTPILVEYLTREDLGIYFLYLTIVGVGGAFDFGIGQTVTKYISHNDGKSERFCKMVISSSLLIYTLISAITLILGAIIIIVNQVLVDQTHFSVGFIFMIGFILQLWYNLVLAILKGNENFKKFALFESSKKLMFGIIGAIIAYQTKSVIFILVSHSVISLIYIFIGRKEFYKYNGAITLSASNNLRFFKNYLYDYSKWVFSQNVIGICFGNIDKFIIAMFLGFGNLSIYEISSRLANLIAGFLSKAFAYILPVVSRISDKGLDRVESLFIKGNFVLSLFLSVIYIIFYFLSVPAITFYLKSDLDLANQVIPIFRILLISSLFISTSSLSSNILNGMGLPKLNTTYALLGNIISVLAIFIGGYLDGINGIVYARLINVATSIGVRTFTYNKAFMQNDYFIGLKINSPLLIIISFVYFIENFL